MRTVSKLSSFFIFLYLNFVKECIKLCLQSMIFRHYSAFKAIFGDLLFPAVPETVLNSSLDFFFLLHVLLCDKVLQHRKPIAHFQKSVKKKKKKNAEDTAALLKTARGYEINFKKQIQQENQNKFRCADYDFSVRCFH